MANNTELKPRSPPSISRPAPISLVIPLKRNEPPCSNENEEEHFSPAPLLPAGVTDIHQGEYERGRITCEVCGTGVGFLDEETGGSTLKHWGAPRLTCSTTGQSWSDPVIYTRESTVDTVAHPPTKRRSAKRNEEEGINYLRADPLCGKWLSINPDDHRQAVKKWLQHQAACQKDLTPTLPLNQPTLPEPLSAPLRTEYQIALAIGPGRAPNSRDVQLRLPHSVSPISPKPGPIFAQSNNAQPRNHTSDNPSFHGINPFNHAPTHESTRRNAEQPAAALTADSLISEVDSNCMVYSVQKWAQLRQDSSYCPYPWLRHRGKCLASASDEPSFQPSHAHNGYADRQRDMAVGNIQRSPTIGVENPIAEANCYLTFAENANRPTATNAYNEGPAQGISESDLDAADHHIPVYSGRNSHALTSTYNPELQTLYRNNGQPFYHPGDPPVDSKAQSPTVAVEIPISTYYAPHHENTNRPTFTNAYTAQGIGESGLAVANYPLQAYRVGNGHTLTNTHNPEFQTLLNGANNMQSSYYPSNLAVGSIPQLPIMAVEAPISANYCLPVDEMYSRVSDGKTVNWHCNFSGCQYVARWRRDIERHCSTLRHGGRQKYKCKYCGKVFVRDDTLSRHVKQTRCWLRQA